MSETEVLYGYDVDLELVDGHRMTVHVDEASAGWYAALTIGEHIVRRARARIITPSCPKCWNSGIERDDMLAYADVNPTRPAEVRRVVCDCPFGQQLLGDHEARRYTTDPIKADSDAELPVGARRAPGPDGRPLEGEWEVGPAPVLRLRMTYLASSPIDDDPAGGGSLKFELQGPGEGRRGTAVLYVTAPEWHALRRLSSTDELVVEVDEQQYPPPRSQAPVAPGRPHFKVQDRDILLLDANYVRLAVARWPYYEFPSVDAKRAAAARVIAAAEKFGVELTMDVRTDATERTREVDAWTDDEGPTDG